MGLSIRPPSALAHLRAVYRLELRWELRRPLFWVLTVILCLNSWGLSTGHLRIAAGDADIGGAKAWLTSEFANAQMLSIVTLLFFSFFVAVAAGMAIIRDDELKVGDLLRSTGLRAGPYVWGKLLAVLTAFGAALLIQLAAMVFFNHAVPNAEVAELRGPLRIGNYLVPALVFSLPVLILVAGISFAVGERTRRPILVFILPVAAVMACGFFLWNWSPAWLDPRIDRMLMLVDPAGFRWLNGTWLEQDRGVEFYNEAAIPFDAPFLVSRAVFVALGLGAVLYSHARFRRAPVPAGGVGRGLVPRRGLAERWRLWRRRAALLPSPETNGAPGPLPEIARVQPPGLLAGALAVGRVELAELRHQPGLYIFIPLILLQTLGTTLLAVGPFDTPLLMTPGMMAARSMNTITLLCCLLMLFYTVEALERERSTGLAPIHHASPVRTFSVLLGKSVAACGVGLSIVLATFASAVIALLVQGKVPLAIGPFLLVWGLLLAPTFLLWTSFVILIQAFARNRYATYAIALGALILTGYLQFTGHMNWVGNWDLWNVAVWTDLGPFELDRSALVLSRVMALGLAALFLVATTRRSLRIERDASRTLHRLEPSAIARAALALLPFAAVPLVSGIALFYQVHQGFQGKAAEKKQKDYWRKNIATWVDAPLPVVTHVDLDVALDPARRSFEVKGSYRLANHRDVELRKFPVTCGFDWTDLTFTRYGAPYQPENRAGLYVIAPPTPLAKGAAMDLGFRYRGTYPAGITKNGGGLSEFVLPAGVVLTSFNPAAFPVLGYDEGIGVDEKNKSDAREYPDDFYEGITDAFVSSASPFTTRIRITAPAEYTCNSVGVKVKDEVAGGKRVSVWESDHPVSFYNVVAGRWREWHGDGTAIYYHDGHGYNVAEMGEALDGARRHYSEWFYPYPWRELKLSEFPALARYAQGFPTNITFSEAIGFLTKSDPRSNAAFMVAAHESAHQWWGNILSPGKGPSGNVLSEGMAHFATMLLFEEVKGERQRMEFAKIIEERYGKDRQVDSERPLSRVDGSRPGDTTVTYDKGGWAAYMLMRAMGRESMLCGLQSFIRSYEKGPDHPVIQDFVAELRPYAPDGPAFDRFVQQWYFSVVVPEYKLSDARKEKLADGRYRVTARVRNVGTGEMPLEIAAARGERFPDADAKTNKPSAPYEDARATVTLGPGESIEVAITCAFEPEKLVADPDVHVLQLRRKQATLKL